MDPHSGREIVCCLSKATDQSINQRQTCYRRTLKRVRSHTSPLSLFKLSFSSRRTFLFPLLPSCAMMRENGLLDLSPPGREGALSRTSWLRNLSIRAQSISHVLSFAAHTMKSGMSLISMRCSAGTVRECTDRSLITYYSERTSFLYSRPHGAVFHKPLCFHSLLHR
ncbi:hypothetical protein BDV19DRAFT_363976 [Aspergillus venezuelensis]